MKIGDLVRVNQDIKEFVDIQGQTPGIVLAIHEPQTNPLLTTILWPDGLEEKLYSDEIELIGSSQ